MTPKQAIAAGTSKAAEFLGRNDIGLISEGKCADLIFVDRNPLTDIEVFSSPDNVLAVIQDGKVVKNNLEVM